MDNVIIKDYLGKKIEFININGELYMNATKAIIGGRLSDWKRSPKTNRIVEELKSKGIKAIISTIGNNAHTLIHEGILDCFYAYTNNSNKNNKSKYLYLLKADKFYKIGVASNVKSRIKTLQTGCMYKIDLVSKWELDKPVVEERKLHKIFSSKRVHGEWFKLNNNDINDIQNRLK